MLEDTIFEFFHRLDSVGSTNEYIKQFRGGRRAGAVMALEQTEGKGRYRRTWYSPRGEGLYASFLVFPNWSLAEGQWLNRLATLAVVRSLRQLPQARQLQLEIKQPNDVLAGGKKLSGVLVESASLEDRLQWAIVGIGVNLSQRIFQLEEHRLSPTSLLLEGVTPPPPRQFCDILARTFSALYCQIEAGGKPQIRREFEGALASGSQKESV